MLEREFPSQNSSLEKEMHPVESDVLLTSQVAKKEGVDQRTVERWIEKGLPAQKASLEQIADMVRRGWISRIPPHGVVLLIKASDLRLIPTIRAYPKGTKRPRKGK